MAGIDLVEKLSLTNVFQWTYGSPRIGNSDFTTYYHSKIPNCWRTVNQKDIVPHLPFRIQDYHHVPTEVWFKKNYYDFIVCDGSGEDPNCSDSIIGSSIVDHLYYLGSWQRDGKPYGC